MAIVERVGITIAVLVEPAEPEAARAVDEAMHEALLAGGVPARIAGPFLDHYLNRSHGRLACAGVPAATMEVMRKAAERTLRRLGYSLARMPHRGSSKSEPEIVLANLPTRGPKRS